ncbi:hypothetical protein KQI68_05185 [Peptoniphilus sp. MSJ-1]|uniref:Uncharacterized protein n=1 Tax=Peptoniphilus ovalis TaxID=2841503 RepID=A0ABS6FGD7_9FIRM|nr:hypothetical protein [Peptoniphilus ovalis]MBU5669234.1 hypothetical protein [Peptoniphilus ovalis]
MSSSVLIFTKYSNGSASIGYEDYGVDSFDGSYFEVTYNLDKKNFKLLKRSLNVNPHKDIESALIEKFGKNFDSLKFENHCNDFDIDYEKYVHID